MLGFLCYFACCTPVVFAQVTSPESDQGATDPQAKVAASSEAGESLTPVEGGEAPAAADDGQTGFLMRFLTDPLSLLLLSAILFMFLVVRPQRRQMDELKQSLANLKKNDRIVLASGIHGTVVQNNENELTVTVRIDDNTGTKVIVNRDSIASVTQPVNNKE